MAEERNKVEMQLCATVSVRALRSVRCVALVVYLNNYVAAP